MSRKVDGHTTVSTKSDDQLLVTARRPDLPGAVSGSVSSASEGKTTPSATVADGWNAYGAATS
jgi:hypothetical protein